DRRHPAAAKRHCLVGHEQPPRSLVQHRLEPCKADAQVPDIDHNNKISQSSSTRHQYPDSFLAFLPLSDSIISRWILTELFNELSDYLNKHQGEIAQDIKDMADAMDKWVKGGGVSRLTSQFEGLATALGKIVDVGKWLAANPTIAGAL